MNKPNSGDKPKTSSEAGVLPGTPAGEPARGPGIVPGTPEDKPEQKQQPPAGRRS